jgi:hypothetical protein
MFKLGLSDIQDPRKFHRNQEDDRSVTNFRAVGKRQRRFGKITLTFNLNTSGS